MKIFSVSASGFLALATLALAVWLPVVAWQLGQDRRPEWELVYLMWALAAAAIALAVATCGWLVKEVRATA